MKHSDIFVDFLDDTGNKQTGKHEDLCSELAFIEKFRQLERVFKASALSQWNTKEGKLLGLTEAQRIQIESIQGVVRKFPCCYDYPEDITWHIQKAFSRYSVELLQYLLSEIPVAGGNYETEWARTGLDLLISIMAGRSDEEVCVDLVEWSHGPLEFTPYPNGISPDDVHRGIMASLLG
ncbi:MAG: hypothetical protein EON58_12060 [Alphaproteobacteria bacterium]|nr:MAG: hypothetical protein EON58_12060 [Alphaproteobacteria bacterium]